MKYAFTTFTLDPNESVIVTGNQALYTYQNTGSSAALIQGSNDTVTWFDIVNIAVAATATKEHSYTYLRLLGNTTVSVHRGYTGSGNADLSDYYTKTEVDTIIDELPSGGGGDYSFSVSDLDLSAIALKEPSILNITPDVVANHHIVGTNRSGTVTGNQDLFSVYWKYVQGKFKFTPNPAEMTVLAFRDEEPTEVFITSSGLNLLYFMSQGGTTGVGIAMSNGSPALFPIDGYQDGMEIAFEIDGLDLNIYAGNQKVGTYQLTTKLGEFVQTVNMPDVPFTSLTYDLTESYADITYQLPSDATDGDIYHLTSNAELFGKKLLANDFIQVYGNKTKIMVNRFKSESRTALNVEPMQLSNLSNIFAYYDPDLKTIHLSGNFYSSTQAANAGLFKVKVKGLAVGLGELSVFAYTPTSIAEFTATFNSGYIEINNPNPLAYGQHVLFDTVIGRIP